MVTAWRMDDYVSIQTLWYKKRRKTKSEMEIYTAKTDQTKCLLREVQKKARKRRSRTSRSKKRLCTWEGIYLSLIHI